VKDTVIPYGVRGGGWRTKHIYVEDRDENWSLDAFFNPFR